MLIPPLHSRQRQKLKLRARPHLRCPLAILKQCPSQSVHEAHGGNQYDILPVSASHLKKQKPETVARMSDCCAAVAIKSSEAGVRLKVVVFRLDAAVPGQEDNWEASVQTPRQVGPAKPASNAKRPPPRRRGTPVARPSQQTGWKPRPGGARDKQPNARVRETKRIHRHWPLLQRVYTLLLGTVDLPAAPVLSAIGAFCAVAVA